MGESDIVTREDARYPSMVRGLNQRFVGTPEYVRLCATPQDVVDALQRAMNEARRPTVRAGGHCYENFVTDNPDGVTLDLAPLRAVVRDEQGRFGIQAGAHLGDVYTQLYKRWGVTIPGGSCFPVGAGGHIIGGGYGLLSRLHGLVVDHLSGVDVAVVDADRRVDLVSVTRDSTAPDERDLFWAHTGGGGGNFGVVTTYWFDELPAAPSEAHLMTLAWDWASLSEENFSELVRRYGEFFSHNSDVGSPYAGLFALLHLTQHTAAQIVLTVQYVGPDPELLETFRSAMCDDLPDVVPQRVPVGHAGRAVPSTDRLTMPWLLMTEALGGSGPPQRGKYKSAYMKTAFPPEQIATIYKWLTDPSYGNSASLLQVDSYGCQVNAVDPSATAVVQRSSVLKLQYQAYWQSPADDAENMRWIRGFYDEMYGPDGPMPGPVMEGAFVNYPDTDLVDWPVLYYGDNYARLRQAKRTWDPLNVFHHAQSIQP